MRIRHRVDCVTGRGARAVLAAASGEGVFTARAVEQDFALTPSDLGDSDTEIPRLMRELLTDGGYRRTASSIASKYASTTHNVVGIVDASLSSRGAIQTDV